MIGNSENKENLWSQYRAVPEAIWRSQQAREGG